MNATIIVNDIRHVCKTETLKKVILYLLDHQDWFERITWQLVMDFGSGGTKVKAVELDKIE